MANSTIARKPYWLNKSRMAKSLGISTQAFDKWGVEPIAKIGREAFYDTRSVLENRLQHQEGKQQPGTLENHNLDPLAEQKLLHERVCLTASQADAQEMRNEVRRGNLIPAKFMAVAIGRLAALVGSALDTIHSKVKRKHPDIATRHVEAVQEEVALARNEAALLHERLPEILNEYLAGLDEGAE